MRSLRSMIVASFASAGLLAAPAVLADSFVILAKGNFSADFESQVQAAGGRVTTMVPEIGVALVDSDNPAFRTAGASIAGVQDIAANVVVRMIEPSDPVTLSVAEAFANPPNSGDDDFYFDLQWGHQAVDAAGAWNAGYRGAGARVAVLDSGIDAEHPDIAPNLNAALSASFVPGEDWNVRPGTFYNHGTHVAGTIAAADNGYGVIGIAPEAEIVAVKVLSEYSGSGSFGGIAAGIVYAANIDADIINMSLGATIPHNCTFDVLDDDGNPTGETEHYPAKDCAALLNMLNRATSYANKMGTTLISSAGNDAADLDHNGSDAKVPAESVGVLTISALAPMKWAADPLNANFDRLASYSNYGQSSIAFGAPGGDYAYAFVDPSEICSVAGVVHYCYVFDYVLSSVSGGWSWSVGTSMASPHAAGVAALIVGKNGGSMSPSALEAALRKSSTDAGKPGRDDVFGFGSVNAANAVAD
ncbi:MAG: S8 family serine peptidase [Proteobacteria bacterium]|nr:S8 family serine peptidase [Pseudomonadota bacterium]